MTFTKKREEQLLQLMNDLSEDMPMRRWKRTDLCDAIRYLQKASVDDANKLNALHDCVIHTVIQLMKKLRAPEAPVTTANNPAARPNRPAVT